MGPNKSWEPFHSRQVAIPSCVRRCRPRPWLIADIMVYWFYLSTAGWLAALWATYNPRNNNSTAKPPRALDKYTAAAEERLNLHLGHKTTNETAEQQHSSVNISAKILLFSYRAQSHFPRCQSLPNNATNRLLKGSVTKVTEEVQLQVRV